MNIAKQRLATQGLRAPCFTSPEEIVRWFGAIQAQEYPISLWALGTRLPHGTTEQSIIDAITQRKIVRTWPMRGTIHYIPAEDARWMLELTARRVNRKFDYYLKKVGLTPAIMEKCQNILTRILQGQQLTRKEIYEQLEAGGISNASKNGLFILPYFSQLGVICPASHRGKQQTFALLEEWVPQSKVISSEEALALLTERYFTSHGPATVYDFAWWSGLTQAEIKHGLALVGNRLVPVEFNGSTYWRATSPLPEASGRSVALLPCFDEYTVSYKDRSAALASDELPALGGGITFNTIVIDGRVVGTWKRSIRPKDVAIELSPIRPFSDAECRDIEAQVMRFGVFLQKPSRITKIQQAG